jgi:hypothetical protein
LSHSQVFGHAREVVDAGRRKRNNNDKENGTVEMNTHPVVDRKDE